jgi:hypothetical protein
MSASTHPPLAASRPDSPGSEAAHAGGISGMLWLTWRQHRWAIVGSLFLAAVLVGWMAYLSIDMTSLYHQCHDAQCPPYSPQDATLFADYGPVRQAETLALVVRYTPLLIGVFLGIPLLAREHEQRTLLLAWSQDVSPLRWLWTKLALLGLFVATLMTVVSAVADHLAHVYSNIIGGGLFADSSFLVTGMLPLASGICWFAVGVALGAAIRRTLPAVFAIIGGFIGLMLGVQWRYPTLMTPLSVYRHLGQPTTGGPDSNAYIVSGRIGIGPGLPTNLFDPSGHELTFAELQRMCPGAGADPKAAFACFARNQLQSHVTYQPPSRIPAFHLIVASGYLGLGVLALAAVWLIVRRTNLSAG